MMNRSRKFLFIAGYFAAYFISAQRNIINVPESEPVEKGSLYIQQQTGITAAAVDAGLTLTYGFGGDFEAGIMLHQFVFNLRAGKPFELDREDPAENPDALINAQKIFRVNEACIGIGTLSGINITQKTSNVSFTTFTYINTRYNFPGTKNHLTFGTYVTNEQYAGEGNAAGLMAGVKWDIIPSRFTFIGDFISGTHSLGLIHAGFQLPLFKKWQLGATAIIPNPDSGNEFGGVLQFTRN